MKLTSYTKALMKLTLTARYQNSSSKLAAYQKLNFVKYYTKT
jgi:hypothetical protein